MVLPRFMGSPSSPGGGRCGQPLGEGTAVHILLPRSQRPAPKPVRPRSPPRPPQPWRRLKMLVVEDERQRRRLCWTCSTSSVTAAPVSPLSPRLWPLLAWRVRPGIVLSDVLLPGGGSGLDLAREMVARRLAVPIILTSGLVADDAAPCHANLPFLRKPYRIERCARPSIGAALADALPQDPPVRRCRICRRRLRG